MNVAPARLPSPPPGQASQYAHPMDETFRQRYLQAKRAGEGLAGEGRAG